MNADENAFGLRVGHCGALRQRNMGVAGAREDGDKTLSLQEPLCPLRDIKGELFFQQAGLYCSGILAAVPRVKDDDRERTLRSRHLDFDLRLSRGRQELQPNERCDHDEQAAPSQERPSCPLLPRDSPEHALKN